MKIVMIGMNDPAGVMMGFANAINRLTTHCCRVISYRSRSSHHRTYPYDIEVARLRNDDYGEIEALLRGADVLHFHMLLDEHYQIGPLHLKDFISGKQLVHHHHGTYDHQCFLSLAPEYLDRYKKNGRTVLVSTPDLLHLLPVAKWVPNPLPIWDPIFQPRLDHLSSRPVRFVQSPTRKWHKHTAEFMRVGERLKLKYHDLVTEVLDQVDYTECMKRKRSSQAVFDHMNGWYGMASLEGLAMGLPTIAGLDDWNLDHIRQFTGTTKTPWVIARTEAELECAMEGLYLDCDHRLELGQRSREFMEKHWNEQLITDLLLQYYR